MIRIALAIVLLALGCAPRQVRNPRLSATYYSLGADYFRKKEPQAAKAELHKAVHYDPENQEAHYLLGVIAFLEGVHAVNFIERGQCLTGAAAREQRETANTSMGRAAEHFRRAIALARRRQQRPDSDALNYLANVALHFERFDEAIDFCNQALDNILYSNQHLALGNRGWAELNKGELTAAARDLRQALFHQPGFCLGRYRLGRVYFEQRQYGAAIDELTRVVDDKACPIQESFKYLGLAYLRKGNRDQAKELLERCVAADPKSCVSFECRRYAKLL